jgi:hypothetical protein
MIVVASVRAGVPLPYAFAHLAGLAQDEEMVAVCAYERVAPLIEGLRAALPRFEIAGIVVDPPTSTEHAVIESLLGNGLLLVAATSESRVVPFAQQLAASLPAAVHHPVERPLDATVH